MRLPKSPEELWRDTSDEDVDEDSWTYVWAERLAAIGIAIALVGLITAPIALALLYFNIQPIANVLILFAFLTGLVGMIFGFGERVLKSEEFRGSVEGSEE